MTVPQEAYDLARAFEGLRLEPYHDVAGFPTIGYGTLLSRERGADLSKWRPTTEAEAEAALTSHLTRSAKSVVNLCPVPLTIGQFSALIDFAFNLGSGSLQASTLRRCVNRGDMLGAIEQFGRWVYAGGVKFPGLVRRRQAEVRVFES